MSSFLSITFLIVAVAGCTAGFVSGADKQIEYNERVELVRCQEGYTKACQQVAARQSINTLGGDR